MLKLKNLLKRVEKELKNSTTSWVWQTADVMNSEWENFEVLFNQKGFYLIPKQDFVIDRQKFQTKQLTQYFVKTTTEWINEQKDKTSNEVKYVRTDTEDKLKKVVFLDVEGKEIKVDFDLIKYISYEKDRCVKILYEKYPEENCPIAFFNSDNVLEGLFMPFNR